MGRIQEILNRALGPITAVIVISADGWCDALPLPKRVVAYYYLRQAGDSENTVGSGWFNLTSGLTSLVAILEHQSGQSLSPCVDVNGDEAEAYLLKAGVLHLTAAFADAPTNWACDQQPSNRLMHYGKTSQHS